MAEATPAATPKENPRFKELADSLWNDSDLGPKVRAFAKAKWPDITVPEDQINPLVKPLEEKAKALQDRIDAMEKDQKDREKAEAERKGQADMETMLEAARKKYALTDEGFDMMVSRMKDTKNYTDAEAAAAWVTDQAPPPSPTSGPTWATQYVDLYGSKKKNENFAMLHKDPDSWLDTQIAEVLKDGNAAA